MNARDEILGKIRSRRARGADSRPEEPPTTGSAVLRSIRPAYAEDPLQRFVRKAEAVAAVVELLGSGTEVPRAVAHHLARHSLPRELSVGEDPWLRALPWKEEGIICLAGTPETFGPVGISRAAYAVAETGTLVLASGAENPMMLNFLPDHHIVVVQSERFVSHPEEVWEDLREDGLPRSLVFVTGPSRTADIEFTIQLGAHGPRHLRILLVDS